MRSPQSFVIGSDVGGQVAIERFQALTASLGYALQPTKPYAKALSILRRRAEVPFDLNDRDDLVLLHIHAGFPEMESAVQHLTTKGRKLILLVHARHAHPANAVRFCNLGWIYDFIAETSGAPQFMFDHVTLAHDREPPYPRIPIEPPERVNRPRVVFIATPFSENLRSDMHAIPPAMAALALEVRGADRYDALLSPIPDQVQIEIAGSFLLIANIRRDEESAPDNANVYYEVGLATGQRIWVFLVRPASEKHFKVPANIDGRRRIEYDHPVELALRLYYGLRHCAP